MKDRLLSPSSLAILPFLAIAALMAMRVLTTRDALELLAGVGAYLAAVSK